MPERSVHTCGSDRYSDPLRAACPGAPGSCPALEMGDAGQRTGTSHYTHQWGPTDKRENRNKWEHGKFQLSVKKNLPPRVLQHWISRPERMRDLYSNLSTQPHDPGPALSWGWASRGPSQPAWLFEKLISSACKIQQWALGWKTAESPFYSFSEVLLAFSRN